MRIPEPAATAIVRDLDGREVRLADLWSRGTVVLAFLRHFG